MLGSARPVRFPECLREEGAAAVPFAVQPGQILMPENCAVALCLDGGRLGLWRPADRYLFRLGAPVGWLGGTGMWTREGVLRLPYATADVPCGVVNLTVPQAPPEVRFVPPPAAPAAPGRSPPAGPADLRLTVRRRWLSVGTPILLTARRVMRLRAGGTAWAWGSRPE